MNNKNIKLKKDEVLVLKSLPANMQAHGGFLWPKSGIVSAPDWIESNECGNGLHGWLWGEGNAELRCTHNDAVWLVLTVKQSTIIDLQGKVKFPSCNVVFCGEMADAVTIIQKHAPKGNKCIFGTATAGYRGTATAGDSGTATAGYRGTATAGDRGTATAGYRGTATAGDSGTATAGNRGTATAGYRGTATAGEDGIIIILYYDSDENLKRKIGLIDGVNLLPGVKYRLNDNNEFEAV